jgi:hypothetical protein
MLSFFDTGQAAKPRYIETPQPGPDPFDGVIAAARDRERAERQQADEEETRKGQRSYGE